MIIGMATSADLDAIGALEAEGFTHASWSRASWAAELDADDRHVLVARSPEGVLGVATFQTVADVADLLRVVVRADQRGRGIARRLVTAGLDWAQAMGAHRMLLEVETGNDSALALYHRFGFEPVGRRDDYYGPGLHALVMSRDLGEELVDA